VMPGVNESKRTDDVFVPAGGRGITFLMGACVPEVT